MAHLGRRPRASGSVIDLSQLPSPSPSGSYHLNHSDSTLSIRMQKKALVEFSTQRPLAYKSLYGKLIMTVTAYSSMAACAAATRAMGTRKGEQLT